MARNKDIQDIGIEFGDWKLVPLDSLNWKLAHRHVTGDTPGARKNGTAGTVRWHRLGKFYQHDTIWLALLFAADYEMKAECAENAIALRDAAKMWKATLEEFKECVSRTARD